MNRKSAAMSFGVIAARLASGTTVRAAVPASVTIGYDQGQAVQPQRLKAPDGRLFELSLSPYSTIGFADLTLFRPAHKPSATNLLEPSGHWHGIEPFEVIAQDCLPGREPLYGRSRDIAVRNYPFVLHVHIVHCDGAPTRDDRGFDRVAFRHLLLTAELRPAK